MKKAIHLLTVYCCLLGISKPVSAQKAKQGTKTAAKADLKFLDDIAIDVPASSSETEPASTLNKTPEVIPQFASKKELPANFSSASIESAANIQFKYSLLLNTEVEQIANISLFRLIDEWYGTPYHLGGSSKAGVDCSGLTQVFFTTLYNINLPRTAREQYELCRKISRSDLKEGDLVFFNTRGGVSHVGFYLQNNKFVHASSGGVTISDLSDDYYARHFIGVGRIDGVALNASSMAPQP